MFVNCTLLPSRMKPTKRPWLLINAPNVGVELSSKNRLSTFESLLRFIHAATVRFLLLNSMGDIAMLSLLPWKLRALPYLPEAFHVAPQNVPLLPKVEKSVTAVLLTAEKLM